MAFLLKKKKKKVESSIFSARQLFFGLFKQVLIKTTRLSWNV